MLEASGRTFIVHFCHRAHRVLAVLYLVCLQLFSFLLR